MCDILNVSMHAALVHFGLDKQSIITKLWMFAPKLVAAVIVLLIATLFYLITARIFEAALRRTPMQSSLIKITVRSLYRGIIAIIALILVLGKLGINVTAALAGVGVVGLAIGFAAQATIANVLSGFGIFMEDLYRKGQWVRIADHYGEVADITLRTTKIRTLDNTYISVPNSLVTSSPVINYSKQGKLRITVNVAIGYKESIDKAREVLLGAVSGIKGVLKNPAPVVVVRDLGESSVNLMVRVWVSEPGFEQRYFFLLTEECKKALDKAKITVPFPQRDIHIIAEKKQTKKSA
jgi:small conductance mechanosensitive channel